jgi:hypothetical protein
VLGLLLLPDSSRGQRGSGDFCGETANLVRYTDPSSTITCGVLRSSVHEIVIERMEPVSHYMLDSGITAV